MRAALLSQGCESQGCWRAHSGSCKAALAYFLRGISAASGTKTLDSCAKLSEASARRTGLPPRTQRAVFATTRSPRTHAEQASMHATA